MNEKRYTEILNRYTKSGKPVKDLSRFISLCNELNIKTNNPQTAPKFIHIAGTNGKGSVTEYISRALEAGGLKTGKFSSPYIIKINERIQINGEPINDSDLSALSETVHKAAYGAGSPTTQPDFSQFEILTAIAFLYFAEKGCAYAVIETGIGGLLDCTNVIVPELSIITAIDHDHSDILGHTIIEIAKHKAGIIKQGIPCILYPEQNVEVKQLIGFKALEKSSETIIPDGGALSIINCSVFGNSFIYKNQEYSTKMGGEHQILNAVTAIEVLEKLGVAKKATITALSKAELPARMQIVSHNPVIIVDGAHNPHGLKAASKLIKPLAYERKILLTGMMKNKDYRSALTEILISDNGFTFSEIIFCDKFAGGGEANCRDLYETAASLGFPHEHIHIVPDCVEAFNYAKKHINNPVNNLANYHENSLAQGGLLLVTGSLYLAGRILNEFIRSGELRSPVV